uniref:Tumor protein p53-inducible protein 13 n=1 Tax=Geotrypetes seraphini TaxID=260995 RepID=A0A6P8PVQ6_GEOSA|nr:tumor protein p53-inducible protein 13 [Geotrypetes seraphini]XP_033778874.1 tumor protein p53-inducible protein 13 [Geotrypetes seraphini]XP_033778875.1 tumor protein p53-inducible protein 13 [Geotrypetes seraphini]XP_033778876.1 tumor protein p53-inducible protein 13 [Geotrypetes seraphini]XP_033778877.1 tumor protein p53-inducible protein 13 [Geotrypetes seraphini]XP_033778878.1 tumor protein p53-inducible protein 13 [Geotrypetes seraphini]XP_033778879.1 tumor protein p53-inducible prot
MRALRQVQAADYLRPTGGTKAMEKGSLRYLVRSERLPKEHRQDKNTTIAPRPSQAIERESTRNAVPSVLHHSTSSRNISEDEVLGRKENSSVRWEKQPNEVAASTASTPRRPHPTNSSASTPGFQRESAGSSVKGGCSCPGSSGHEQAPLSHQLASHQKGAMANGRQGLLQRSPNSHIPTPRTEEATWAAAALIFLFVLLTLAVLYTRLYRHFRRSRSLYWDLWRDAAGQETVSSVIKGRLLSRKNRRKRWQKHRQPPLLLQEGDSESSA